MFPAGDPEFGDGLELHVALRHIAPLIWRRLLVPADLDLAELHEVLQVTFGWENSHLHAFEIGGFRFRDYDNLDEDDSGFYLDEQMTLVGAVARKGVPFTYAYDFGDGWKHDVRVESVVQGERLRHFTRIECLAGARRCPPEDCGGPPGYEHLLAVLGNPSDPEFAEVMSLAGRKFDPEAFDVAKVNKKLATLAKRFVAVRKRM